MEFEIYKFIRLENTKTFKEGEPIRIGIISVHIKTLGIFIQGINVYKRKDVYTYELPSFKMASSGNGKHFSFPIFTFEAGGSRRLFHSFMQKNLKKFMKEWFEENPDIPTAIERENNRKFYVVEESEINLYEK